MGGTALGASGRSNNGLKLDVKTGKLSLWRLFPTFFLAAVPAPAHSAEQHAHETAGLLGRLRSRAHCSTGSRTLKGADTHSMVKADLLVRCKQCNDTHTHADGSLVACSVWCIPSSSSPYLQTICAKDLITHALRPTTLPDPAWHANASRQWNNKMVQ